MQNSNEKIIRIGIPVLAGAIMFVGLVLILFGPSTTGNTVLDLSELSEADLADIKEKFNLNLDKIPRFVKSMFGNERMNIHVDQEGETKEFSAVTSKGKILLLEEGSLEDRTLDVWVSQETIDRISSSDDPVEELRTALQKKEIQYETYAMPTKIRMGLAKFSFGIYSLFKR